MPQIKSAMKRMRQNEKRRTRNRMVRSRMRTFVKKANNLISEGDKDAAEIAVKEAISEFDRAAQKGTIHHPQSNPLPAYIQQVCTQITPGRKFPHPLFQLNEYAA